MNRARIMLLCLCFLLVSLHDCGVSCQDYSVWIQYPRTLVNSSKSNCITNLEVRRCQQICLQSVNCNGINWNEITKGCCLLDTTDTKSSANGWVFYYLEVRTYITGASYCPAYSWAILPNTSTDGSLPVYASSYLSCMNFCIRTCNCSGFDWNPSSTLPCSLNGPWSTGRQPSTASSRYELKDGVFDLCIDIKGCYKDSAVASSFQGETITLLNCRDFCFKEGFMYAGAQYRMCSCSNTYGSSGISIHCTLRCSGDNSLICGGNDANIVMYTGADKTVNCKSVYTAVIPSSVSVSGSAVITTPSTSAGQSTQTGVYTAVIPSSVSATGSAVMTTPSTSAGQSTQTETRVLAVALSVGLGVPLVIAIIVIVVMQCRKAEKEKLTRRYDIELPQTLYPGLNVVDSGYAGYATIEHRPMTPQSATLHPSPLYQTTESGVQASSIDGDYTAIGRHAISPETAIPYIYDIAQ